MSGSGISWAVCKSAPRSRQITMQAPHHSAFTGRMPFLPPNQQRQSTEGMPKAPDLHRNWWRKGWRNLYTDSPMSVLSHTSLVILRQLLKITTTTAILRPLCRSSFVSRHLQLTTGGFCWCKVLLTACPCWQQPAHSGTLEFSSTVLSTLSPYLKINIFALKSMSPAWHCSRL